MRLVKILWQDSYGVGSSWEDIGEIDDVAHQCISVGFLAKDGKHIKVLVPHLSPANDVIGNANQGCGDMAVPCCSIIEMIDLIEAPK